MLRGRRERVAGLRERRVERAGLVHRAVGLPLGANIRPIVPRDGERDIGHPAMGGHAHVVQAKGERREAQRDHGGGEPARARLPPVAHEHERRQRADDAAGDGFRRRMRLEHDAREADRDADGQPDDHACDAQRGTHALQHQEKRHRIDRRREHGVAAQAREIVRTHPDPPTEERDLRERDETDCRTEEQQPACRHAPGIACREP